MFKYISYLEHNIRFCRVSSTDSIHNKGLKKGVNYIQFCWCTWFSVISQRTHSQSRPLQYRQFFWKNGGIFLFSHSNRIDFPRKLKQNAYNFRRLFHANLTYFEFLKCNAYTNPSLNTENFKREFLLQTTRICRKKL